MDGILFASVLFLGVMIVPFILVLLFIVTAKMSRRAGDDRRKRNDSGLMDNVATNPLTNPLIFGDADSSHGSSGSDLGGHHEGSHGSHHHGGFDGGGHHGGFDGGSGFPGGDAGGGHGGY